MENVTTFTAEAKEKKKQASYCPVGVAQANPQKVFVIKNNVEPFQKCIRSVSSGYMFILKLKKIIWTAIYGNMFIDLLFYSLQVATPIQGGLFSLLI